jgi:DNA polymerase III delta prime subunit
MAQINLADTSRMPHACLISAADMNTAMDEARRLAAAALCEDSGEKPCGICRHCRKALAGIHPDIIHIARIVDDKGKQKKQIGVDQIRAMSADACMLPNEAARKVYIIEDAESMNPNAQNAALKLLEEPPLGAMFLLCCCNAMQLLPTVRSRCAEFNLAGRATEEREEKSGLAGAYIKAVGSGDAAGLLRWCCQNEGLDSAAAGEFLTDTKELLTDMLCGREKSRNLSREDMLRLCKLIDKCIEGLRVNMGVKHIFGLLAVDSIAGSRNRG